jgi:hypothetical protein
VIAIKDARTGGIRGSTSMPSATPRRREKPITLGLAQHQAIETPG